ncbi:2-C-methyl-D-erythritol 4-phosphate cytidylyltransferase 1 [Pseudovibrio sp. Ad46]|uniref:IspD/TarI family cytidylyltransferase n=1 Tax=Pseudovibrio sp. Ad46 TaxID=989432 RepID=UPI0007AE79AB|nr:IspD/TarI family cytidylyltransferase [Pseudovibrio sp. Ad46]KZK94702.1 2-C-methyl-D-erythritol 4-phosphate cytidylyltransferase 1 [Pseudovibrio sp. Ad46]
MSVAIIFGGGVGARFSKSGTPKQFVELYGKPIIVYTLEHFSNNPHIEEIVIPCVAGWADFLKDLIERFNIRKRCHIIPGGATSHESRLNALDYIKKNIPSTETVVMHDAVRPIITQDIITNVVKGATEHGAAASYVSLTETPAETDDFQKISTVHNRSSYIIVKAPQAFNFIEAYRLHINGKDLPEDALVDSCTLMSHYGKNIHLVETSYDNIKITTAKDYFIFKALVDASHYESIFGLP